MEICKKIAIKLLFPPIFVYVLVIPVAAVLLGYAAIFEDDSSSVISIVSYVLSAYALTILCCKAPAIFKWIKRFKNENTYIQRYTSDAHLRIEMSLFNSVGINTLYALMQLVSGIVYGSFWFYSLSGYYVLLALMRYFLFKEARKCHPGENQFRELLHYRFCGILLLLMNLFLSAIVFFIVRMNRGFQYHYIQTIAMAAFTFTTMTLAIVNVVRYRKYNSPLLSAATVISLVSALVSMLSLETAMLTAFGETDDPQLRLIMTAATGSAVCAIVLALAIFMIVKSTKRINLIKKERKENEREK